MAERPLPCSPLAPPHRLPQGESAQDSSADDPLCLGIDGYTRSGPAFEYRRDGGGALLFACREGSEAQMWVYQSESKQLQDAAGYCLDALYMVAKECKRGMPNQMWELVLKHMVLRKLS